eukprot:gene7185-9979_t
MTRQPASAGPSAARRRTDGAADRGAADGAEGTVLGGSRLPT